MLPIVHEGDDEFSMQCLMRAWQRLASCAMVLSSEVDSALVASLSCFLPCAGFVRRHSCRRLARTSTRCWSSGQRCAAQSHPLTVRLLNANDFAFVSRTAGPFPMLRCLMLASVLVKCFPCQQWHSRLRSLSSCWGLFVRCLSLTHADFVGAHCCRLMTSSPSATRRCSPRAHRRCTPSTSPPTARPSFPWNPQSWTASQQSWRRPKPPCSMPLRLAPSRHRRTRRCVIRLDSPPVLLSRCHRVTLSPCRSVTLSLCPRVPL